MESGEKQSRGENHSFYCATLFSYFFLIYPFCVTTQSSLKPSFPLTDRRHHFVVGDSPQLAPCKPHNNTLKTFY